jgi:hypothetical protein
MLSQSAAHHTVYSVAFYMDHDKARTCLAPFKQLEVHEMRDDKRLNHGEHTLHMLVIGMDCIVRYDRTCVAHKGAGPCTLLLKRHEKVHRTPAS